MENVEPRAMVGHRLLLAAVAVMMTLGFSMVAVQQAHATNQSWYDSAASSFAGGNGTSSNPYQIETAAQLAYLSKVVSQASTQSAYNTSSVYYKLTADITLNAAAVTSNQVNISTPGTDGVGSAYAGSDTLKEWYPIGGGSTSYSFKGHFDGDGKTIYNIFYNHSDGSYASGNSAKNNAGLFGKVEVGAEVKNVTVSGGYFGGQRSIGAIAGKSWGTIDSCDNAGVYVYSNQSKGVGGICGASWVNSSTDDAPVIINCKNSGKVVSAYSSGSAGGIAGENEGDVVNCANIGTIESPHNAGGLIGSNKHIANKQDFTVSGLLLNSYNRGSVGTSSTTYAGGLIGYQAYSARNCYSCGIITGTNAGQLFGQYVSTTGATNDYLYYPDGTTAVGTGSYTGGITFTDGSALCTTLNANKSTLQLIYTSYTLATWLYDSLYDAYPYFA